MAVIKNQVIKKLTVRQDGNPMELKDIVSDEFRRWYAKLLPNNPPENWKMHPHFYLRSKKIIKSQKAKSNEIIDIIDNINLESYPYLKNHIIASNPEIAKRISHYDTESLLDAILQMPPITSSSIFENPNSIRRLLDLDGVWCCVIEVSNIKTYLENWKKLSQLTSKFNEYNELIKIVPANDWLQISQSQKHLFISRFLGQTLDQTYTKLSSTEKINFQKISKEFLTFCDGEGIYWSDFAPRNLILNGNQLNLIDFEHLYLTKDLSTYDRKILSIARNRWFGDIFSSEEVNRLLADEKESEIDYSLLISADNLEATFYNKDRITVGDKISLLLMTNQVERQHRYKGKIIMGHHMGLFLSDYVSEQYEAKIYILLKKLPGKDWPKFLYHLNEFIDKDQANLLSSFYGFEKPSNYTTKYIDSAIKDHATIKRKDEGHNHG